MPHKDPVVRAAYHRAYYLRLAALKPHPLRQSPAELNRRRVKAWQRRNPEWVARNDALNKARMSVRRSLNRAIADGELARGCVDCGEKDLRVLEFDHVRGTKVVPVAIAIARGWPPTRLYAEIDKCEVRCSNCHQRVTYERRKAAA